jgi:molybdate transport system ATP-binding protein
MSFIKLKHKLQRGGFQLDVDTRIPATGITGVFGESGSGKTTLLRCIAGLEASLSNDERPPQQRRIGVVFQEPRLFSHLDVRGNIEYGLRRGPDPRASIDEIVKLLGLENMLERSVMTLSGGEAQRVAMARALCLSPQLILMDEPLSALDQRRKEELIPYLDRLHIRSFVPIVYVSHNIDEISRLVDHLLVLDAGRIVADGDLQTVLARLDLPQLGGRNAGTVIEAQPVHHDKEFDLTLFRFSGGELWAPGSYTSKSVRLRTRASDVSLILRPADNGTILNVIAAVIDATEAESRATQLVRLRVGDDFLLARITRRSWQQLALTVGDSVFAQLKSVTVRR